MSKEESLQLVISEIEGRIKFEREFDSLLFPIQGSFIKDQAKRKAAICSRRAGKTTGIARDLIKEIRTQEEGDTAYIGLTRGAAKRTLFKEILKLDRKYNLNLHIDKTELWVTSKDTGNTLYITGANTEDEAEKLRGLKLKKAVLDEVASFRAHINYLIEEVLEPTLIDTDGSLVLIGTPSANPTDDNLFYRVTTGLESGWSVHKWTILDNPYIPHARVWLEEYRKRKQWGLDHPIYLREWLGEWTTDSSSLVYKYDSDRNDYSERDSGKWNFVVGIDIGFDDAFAINVNAFSYDHLQVYSVYQYKKSGLIPAQMAEVIKDVRARFNPIRMVADHGGLGKAICEEFNQRYGLNIYPAEKSKKMAYVELLNGDLLSGLYKIKRDSELAKEMRRHQWDPDKPGKEDDRTVNDLCDASLYSWRECKHFLGEEKARPPEKGTKEWHDMEAQALLEKEMEAFQKQQDEEMM